MPPALARGHKSYHDHDEEDDEPHPQRRRGGFFGAPAAAFGPPGEAHHPRLNRRMLPVDEDGNLVTDATHQANIARRHRQEAAYQSLDDASDNFVERYDHVVNESDPVVRAALLAFLLCPIYRGVLENLIEKDIVFPFAFLLFRPFIVHNMATAILTKKGAETGETLIGHADFQLGDDVARKMCVQSKTATRYAPSDSSFAQALRPLYNVLEVDSVPTGQVR
jgi:hypothetical protein